MDFIGVSTDHLLIKKKTLRMKKTFIIHRPKIYLAIKFLILSIKTCNKIFKKIIGNFDIILMIQPTSVQENFSHQ